MTGEARQQQQAIVRDVSWREVFPWVHLFRAFRIAIHPSKLALAWVLLFGLYVGGRALDGLWSLAGWGDYGIFLRFFSNQAEAVKQIATGVASWDWLGYGGVLDGMGRFLFAGPAAFYQAHPVYAALFTVWFLILWAVFGGAIARIAAVHVARDEKMSVRQAIRFSSGKMLSFIFAPLIPLLIMLALGVVLAAAGWVLLHVPWAGPIVLGAFFILALVLGAVMTLVVLGTVGGFNLMYPTIAVEGSDSFDAISRSFSYVYARPWRTLWYTLLSVAYGALCYLFVRLFLYLTLSLTQYFVGWWLGGDPAFYWGVMWPSVRFDNLSYDIPFGSLKGTEDVAASLIAFWVYMVITLLGAFVISFYFSASTVTYVLLRREVDATDIDDVYVEEMEEDFSEAPPVAPEKVNGPGPVAVTAGPLAGPPVAPPSGGEPTASTSADLAPMAPTATPGRPAPDQGSAKVHPTASTPQGQDFVKPGPTPTPSPEPQPQQDNLVRPNQDGERPPEGQG